MILEYAWDIMHLGGGGDGLRFYDPCIQGPAAFITSFSKTVRYKHNGIPLNDGTRYMLTEGDRKLFEKWRTM